MKYKPFDFYDPIEYLAIVGALMLIGLAVFIAWNGANIIDDYSQAMEKACQEYSLHFEMYAGGSYCMDSEGSLYPVLSECTGGIIHQTICEITFVTFGVGR